MSPFYVIPGFDHLGEVRIHCEMLRKRGLSSLVIVNTNCAADYSDCADRLILCPDMFSEEVVAESLSPYRKQLAQFVTAHDKIWPAILGASIRLGIPFQGLRGQVNCLIKPKMRELLRETLPLKSDLISLQELAQSRVESAVNRIGVPFVLKPIWGQGCNYVEFIKDGSRAFDRILQTFSALQKDSSLRPFHDDGKIWDPRAQLLMEEFISGREFSLEGFIQNGRFVPLMIQEKFHWTQVEGLDFETSCLSPTPFLEAEAKSKIHSLVEDALKRLGLNNTLFHVEFKWDGQRFNLIEVNPRMGGGSVPAVLNFWFGIDVREMALKLRMGETLPDVYTSMDGFLLGVFINALESGLFDAMEGLDWVKSRPEFCFATSYFRTWQFIPPIAESISEREAWMYGYDVFYWCHDTDQIDYLHDQTRKRVRVKLKTEREIVQFLSMPG